MSRAAIWERILFNYRNGSIDVYSQTEWMVTLIPTVEINVGIPGEHWVNSTFLL